MKRFAEDSQQIKNSITVDNKNRFNTSYGKMFEKTKNFDPEKSIEDK